MAETAVMQLESPGMPGLQQAQKLGRGTEEFPFVFHCVSNGITLQHLEFELLAFRTVRRYISVFKATHFVLFCFDNPEK